MTDAESGTAGGPRRMRLRYAGTCELCGRPLPARAEAIYDSKRRKVRCVECPSVVEADVTAQPAPEGPPPPREGVRDSIGGGTAGASALREYERRSSRRTARIDAAVAKDTAWREQLKQERPVLGRVRAVFAPRPTAAPVPQHITAWKQGAEGEQALGRRLDEWSGQRLGLVLHDRRIPRTKANIDHVAIAPNGIWVIDAKEYSGVVEQVNVGGWLNPDMRLNVNGRDKSARLATAFPPA